MANGSAMLARGRLRSLRRAANTFGFYLAGIDLRQNSEVHERGQLRGGRHTRSLHSVGKVCCAIVHFATAEAQRRYGKAAVPRRAG
jgi:5-methylcytosine-specific restriction endonuclease McrBC regulatory subunit McrC